VLRAELRADLIAVPDDPLRHLDVLRAPTLVMIGGRIVHRVQQHPPT
jgi:imidazolonepropionase-like amidohydrolase